MNSIFNYRLCKTEQVFLSNVISFRIQNQYVNFKHLFLNKSFYSDKINYFIDISVISLTKVDLMETNIPDLCWTNWTALPQVSIFSVFVQNPVAGVDFRCNLIWTFLKPQFPFTSNKLERQSIGPRTNSAFVPPFGGWNKLHRFQG